MKRFKYLFWIQLLFVCSIAGAQQISVNKALDELSRMQHLFRPERDRYVSFRLTYLYNSPSGTGSGQDSLQGYYKAFGDRRYSKISNTESIQDSSTALILYNDNRIALIGKLPGEKAADKNLFLNSIDSGFIAKNVSGISLTRDKNIKTLKLTFSDTSKYYNCSIRYLDVSYIPVSISYTLRPGKNVNPNNDATGKGSVTIEFSDYNQEPFDLKTIDMKNYITVTTDHHYVLQPAYVGYQLVDQGTRTKKQMQ